MKTGITPVVLLTLSITPIPSGTRRPESMIRKTLWCSRILRKRSSQKMSLIKFKRSAIRDIVAPRLAKQTCSPDWCSAVTAERNSTSPQQITLMTARISSPVQITDYTRKNVRAISSERVYWSSLYGHI